MIKAHITNVVHFHRQPPICFDLHKDYGLASLIESDSEISLNFNGVVVQSWQKSAYPLLNRINWFSYGHVILFNVRHSAAIASATEWHTMAVGWLNQPYLSQNYLYITYSEETFYSANQDELESNIISVFSRDGTFELGLGDFLKADRSADLLSDIEAAYTYSDTIVFIDWEMNIIWILDMVARTYRKIPVSFSLVCADVLSGDDKKAYAVFDNRSLLREHPDYVPFELAAFDLVAETSAKQDFAPIKKELIASGFKIETLKFQPSSTGKIIVSDGEKAAFLEFADDV